MFQKRIRISSALECNLARGQKIHGRILSKLIAVCYTVVALVALGSAFCEGSDGSDDSGNPRAVPPPHGEAAGAAHSDSIPSGTGSNIRGAGSLAEGATRRPRGQPPPLRRALSWPPDSVSAGPASCANTASAQERTPARVSEDSQQRPALHQRNFRTGNPYVAQNEYSASGSRWSGSAAQRRQLPPRFHNLAGYRRRAAGLPATLILEDEPYSMATPVPQPGSGPGWEGDVSALARNFGTSLRVVLRPSARVPRMPGCSRCYANTLLQRGRGHVPRLPRPRGSAGPPVFRPPRLRNSEGAHRPAPQVLQHYFPSVEGGETDGAGHQDEGRLSVSGAAGRNAEEAPGTRGSERPCPQFQGRIKEAGSGAPAAGKAFTETTAASCWEQALSGTRDMGIQTMLREDRPQGGERQRPRRKNASVQTSNEPPPAPSTEGVTCAYIPLGYSVQAWDSGAQPEFIRFPGDVAISPHVFVATAQQQSQMPSSAQQGAENGSASAPSPHQDMIPLFALYPPHAVSSPQVAPAPDLSPMFSPQQQSAHVFAAAARQQSQMPSSTQQGAENGSASAPSPRQDNTPLFTLSPPHIASLPQVAPAPDSSPMFSPQQQSAGGGPPSVPFPPENYIPQFMGFCCETVSVPRTEGGAAFVPHAVEGGPAVFPSPHRDGALQFVGVPSDAGSIPYVVPAEYQSAMPVSHQQSAGAGPRVIPLSILRQHVPAPHQGALQENSCVVECVGAPAFSATGPALRGEPQPRFE